MQGTSLKGTGWRRVTQDATQHGSASQTHRFQARPGQARQAAEVGRTQAEAASLLGAPPSPTSKSCVSRKLPPHLITTSRGLHFPASSRRPAATKLPPQRASSVNLPAPVTSTTASGAWPPLTGLHPDLPRGPEGPGTEVAKAESGFAGKVLPRPTGSRPVRLCAPA